MDNKITAELITTIKVGNHLGEGVNGISKANFYGGQIFKTLVYLVIV